jgi:hypothetical protein
MQRNLVVPLALSFLLVAAFVYAAQSGTFNVTLVVGNDAPLISWVNSSFSLTPVENSTGVYQFTFNATDANGAADLDDASATVRVALGTQTATSSACTGTASGNTKYYNCSVALPYYYNASASWSINASVEDIGNSYAENTTQTFTYNELKAIALQYATLSFSGSAGASDLAASQGAQRIYNTGNYDFLELNLTAYDLRNGTNAWIGAGNFTVNITASGGLGQLLVNSTAVNVTNGNLTHAQGTSTTLNLYLDIPGGQASGTYSAASSFIVDMY